MSDTGKERRTRHPRLVLDIGEEAPVIAQIGARLFLSGQLFITGNRKKERVAWAYSRMVSSHRSDAGETVIVRLIFGPGPKIISTSDSFLRSQ